MKQVVIKLFTLSTMIGVLVSCGASGGGGSGSGGGGVTGIGKESAASKLICNISIAQDAINLNSTLEANCPDIFSVINKADGKTWSIGGTNTCAFASIDGAKIISGAPTDDQVGTCNLIVHATAAKITVFKATVTITNTAPTLSITGTTIVEDDVSAVIRLNTDVVASEEGLGNYTIDNANTTGTKCSDNGVLSVDTNNGAVTFAPALHFNGACEARVVFNDGNASSNTVSSQFTVNVTAVNDAPAITNTCATATLDQDIAYTCSSLVVFDPETGDTQTWSLDATNTCAWATVAPSTGAVSGIPTDDQVGICTLAVKVNDGTLDSVIYSRSVNVTNVTPVLATLATIEAIAEDATATIVITAANVTSTEEGLGVYSLDNAATTGTKCSDNGVVAIDTSTGAVTLTPTANFNGNCNVRVVFDDQNATGNTDFKEATIYVGAVNDAIVITSTCNTTPNELAAYTCNPTFTDEEGDSATWSLNAANTCAWASMDGSGVITGTPTRAQVGACNLVVTANDGTVDTDRTYSVTVTNLVPIITVAATTLAEDAALTIIRTAAEVTSTDEGFGTYSIGTAASNNCGDVGTVSINAADGEVSFAPNGNYDQACNIRVSFDDGQALSNVGNTDFVLTMIPSPDNAVVSLPAACDVDLNEDIAYTCTPVITDPDTGDTHTWSIDANTCGFIAGVTASTGVMSGTSHDDQVGACTFTIKATGDQDALVAPTLTANFSVINVQPVITGTSPVNINMHHTTAAVAYAAVIQNTATALDVTSTDETHGVFAFGTPSSVPCSAIADTHTIDTATGITTFLPNDKYVGTCKIKIDFDDQNALNNTATSYEYDVNVIDQVPPVIQYIDSSTADGTYYLGGTVNITVKFDEPIVVNTAGGNPRVFLETGVVDREAVYTGQGGGDNSELYFTYTIQKDDDSTDLEVHNTVSYLDLAGATVQDTSGNTLPNFAIPKPADVTGNSLSERRAIVIDGSVAEAQIAGMPTLVSPDLQLDVTVSGTGVINYQYKLREVGTANDTCADSVGYSANTVVATKIADLLISYSLGAQLRLCVVGITAVGIVQPYDEAMEYVWSKDTNSIQKVSFDTVTNLPNWQDSEVDPDNRNIVYARNLLGEVYKSIDTGANWVKQCTLPQTYSTSMEVSPGPDRTPYAMQNGTVYKITESLGAACPNILTASTISGNVLTGYGRKFVSFATNGDIYVATDKFGGVQLHKSFDQGANWSIHATLTPVTYNTNFSVIVDPNDVSHILFSKRTATVDPSAGLYESTDTGATFTRIGGHRSARLIWHPSNSAVVYGGYRIFSEISADAGTTWVSAGESTSVSSTTNLYNRFDIDKVTGNAYRLINSGSNTKLQKATDIVTAGVIVWSDVYTFSGVTGIDTGSKNVSVSGNAGTPASPTISVNILNQMWTSSDGGTSFTERFAAEELKLLTIAGSGDDAIYGATKDWFVVKTNDNGSSWDYKVGDYYHCLGKAPRLQVNQINTANILMWTENYGTIDCDSFNYSVDSMTTLVERDSFSMVAPKLVVSMSPYDPKKYYISGKVTDEDFKFHKTSNSAFETTLTTSAGNEFSDPMPDSYIHPHNDSIIWVVDNIGNGILYEYDLSAGTRTNITSRTGLTTVAGLDVYPGDKGQYYIRVMDRTGRMKTSIDYGANFVNQGSTGTPLTSCNQRFLYHHPKDRNLVVSACVEGNFVAISKDSGTTWDETDLFAEYSISCTLTGIAVSSSRMYIGCSTADTMIFNYAFAQLKNDVTDSILTTVEHGNATDIIEHFFPGNYPTLEYAVILASATCDVSVGTFSTTIPKSNDAAFTTRGEYKVCIKQTDLAAAVSYTTTSTIFYDDGSPTFTSVALINDVADSQLTYVEHYNNSLLVGSLVSADHDFVKYAVAYNATTCDVSLDYSFEIPKSNNEFFTTAGSYKVCVELSTRGGTAEVYGASPAFTYAPTQVFASLSGTPVAYVSVDKALSVTVSGTNVTQYKHKLITSGSCEDSSGYSAATPIGTLITDSLTGYSSGDNIILCVTGGDAAGLFQVSQRATEHKWVYSTNYRIDPIDFSSVTTFSDWRQVKIHGVNDNLIYGLNTMGEIWKSEDKGSSWDLQCRVPAYRTGMHMKVSPGPDGTAYISHHYSTWSTENPFLYRVDAKGGRGCPNTISDFRGDSPTNFIHTNFTMNASGDLFQLENQYDSIVLRKSTDQGRNWTFVSQLQDSGLNGQLSINPMDESVMLISTRSDNTGSGTRGLYKSTDSGINWSFIQATGFTDAQNIFFDPINANRVYANNQYISTDNGSSWSTNAQFNSAGIRWDVDPTGKGYRLAQSGSDTILYRSNTLNPASFTSHYIFSSVQSGDITYDTVSANGNTIALVINKKMFISTNAGVAFTEVFWPGSQLRLTGINSSDGEQIYGVAKTWNIFSSGDGAGSWNYHRQFFNQSCENDARVYAHHLDNNYAWVYSDNCDIRGVGTSDAFATNNDYGGTGTVTSDFGFFVNTTFPDRYVMVDTYSSYDFLKTSNSWASTTTLTDNQSLFSSYSRFDGPGAFSKVYEPDTYLFIEAANKLYEARLANEPEIADINSRLTYASPATVAISTDKDRSDLQHLVVSTAGVMNISADDGKTFSLLGTSSTGLTTCDERLFYSYPNNDQLMVQACNKGTELAWTTNRGSSWTRIDLNSYFGINCAITGLVMNNSEIMFSCKSGYDGMRFYYTAGRLIAGAKDNILTAAEITGADIINIGNPADYVTAEYVIIAAGAACNAGSGVFSSTIPKDSDISGMGDGKYQVCMKLNNGSTVYQASTQITYNGTAPVFTSIDLANAATDGIQLTDFLETSTIIVNNLVGSNYDSAKYALVSNVTTCNGGLNYSSTIPRSNSDFFTVEGSYKVCVSLTDGVNAPAYGSSSAIVFSKDQVRAELAGVPNKISADALLNITVSGLNVDAYQYKVGVGTQDCTASAGYSGEIAVATLITDNISGLANGVVDICVRGIDNTNFADQVFYQATKYSWTKGAADIDFIGFNIDGYSQNWFDVEVAKWGTIPHIYGRDFKGNIFISYDRASSFKFVCSMPHDANSRMMIAPVKGHGAFATANGVVYRLDNQNGGDCKNLSGLFTAVVSTFQRAPISFNSKGEIYIVDEVSATQSDLYKSNNLGDSWTLVKSFSEALTNLTVNIDPFNDDNIFLVYEGASTSFGNDYILSKNGGETFYGKNPNGPGDSVALIQNLSIDFKFDPVNQGYLYANNGYYTSDNFNRLVDGTGTYSDDFARWDIDGTGSGYRLVQNGANIDFEKSNNMTVASFSVSKTISSVTAAVTDRTVSVSSDGATVMVVADKKMYASLDNAAFSEVFTPTPKLEISSISSEDNTVAYIADDNWNFMKTINAGSAWTFGQTLSTACAKKPRVRTHKSDNTYVTAYAEDASGSCAAGGLSTDGLATAITGITPSFDAATQPTLAQDPSNILNTALIANGGLRYTNNSWAAVTQITLPSVSNASHGFDGFMSTNDSTLVYNVYSDGKLRELDLTGLTKTDITSSLVMSTPAAIEGFPDGTVYVMSRTGQIDVSANDAGSFSAYSADPALATCTSRHLKALASSPGTTIATACNGGSTIAYTLDSGTSWTEVNLSSFTKTTACSIRDIAIIESSTNKIYVACDGLEAVYLEMN